MSGTFRIGISDDFYTEASEPLQYVLAKKLAGVAGVEWEKLETGGGRCASAELLRGYDAVFALATKIDAESLREVERLAVVARWGVGYDRIDVPALTRAGVALTITPAAVRRPVAEAILTLIFALSKNLLQQDRVARAGGWRGDLPRMGTSIGGRTLGSVGCGNIGQELFREARSLGFGRFLACDPNVSQEKVRELGVEMVDMETLFRESDFVTVNTLLNERTRGLVREAHFRLMKPSAYFINTARGPVVEHEGLVRALRENWIAGAGIDVYPVEPPPADDPLFRMDNVIVAPHALAWTNELMTDNGSEACDAVLAVCRGEVPEGLVNPEVLNVEAFQTKLARRRG
ncbi:MAG: dehydrogenase [Bryobacterales bacterium]|nr:dehydrogenase [Bryobacterales bacterium]